MADEESTIILSSGEEARIAESLPVKRRLQFVTSRVDGGVPDLSKCTAKRTLWPGGVLVEVIRLDGSEKWMEPEVFDGWLRTIRVTEK